jgi:hypothetical protein
MARRKRTHIDERALRAAERAAVERAKSTKKDTSPQKARKATNAASDTRSHGGESKNAPASPPAATNDVFAQAFASWKAGVQIHALAASLGLKRSKLRRRLIQIAGGKEAFRSFRTSGAGGTVEAFGGKRATGGRTKEAIEQDDSRVQQLTRGDMRLEHWRHEWLRSPFGSFPVLVSPDGLTKYSRANATERADLILDSQTPGLALIRLKKLSDSALARLAKQEEKNVERGEAAIERTRARKRSAKQARRRTPATTEA